MPERKQDLHPIQKHAPTYCPEFGPSDWVGVGDQHERQARRAATLRVAGLLGFLLSDFVLLSFGLETLSELQKARGVDVAIHRRWVVRMTCVLTLAMVAAVANLGLIGLRNWARLALTNLYILPVMVFFGDGVLLAWIGPLGTGAELGEEGITVYFLLAVACGPLPLYLLWFPLGGDVFSSEPGKGVVDQARWDAGGLSVVDAMVFALTELGSCFSLTFAVLSLLADLGIIRSI